MNDRGDNMIKNIKIFNDTLKQCHENEKLAESIKKSIENTILYKADDYPEIKRKSGSPCRIEVTRERTVESAKNLHKIYPDKKIGILNFASAVNAGGGVVLGANAQEESICRCTTLYPCLNTKELLRGYYNPHRTGLNIRYTDACIYTPDIIVMKSDAVRPENVPENEWYNIDVITCAAPNLSMARIPQNELYEIHKKRGSHILSIAVANEIDILVLGAFGCGAFRNNPETVSKAYVDILPDFMRYFTEIRFAVYYVNNSKNFDTFSKISEKLDCK